MTKWGNWKTVYKKAFLRRYSIWLNYTSTAGIFISASLRAGSTWTPVQQHAWDYTEHGKWNKMYVARFAHSSTTNSLIHLNFCFFAQVLALQHDGTKEKLQHAEKRIQFLAKTKDKYQHESATRIQEVLFILFVYVCELSSDFVFVQIDSLRTELSKLKSIHEVLSNKLRICHVCPLNFAP